VGKLDGRVALVTGGARGQGRSHALAMAAECAAVVVCDIAADLDVVPYPLASRSDLEETSSLKQDFENRLKVLNYGLNGRPYVDAEHISRALMYLVTDDDGVISGQVMDVALGGSATGIH
jgi:hypothetical protein